MTQLVLAADGAYPQADYAFLPAAVTWWLGYLGGETPHAWTAGEIAHLEATGRRWAGIWTAPQGAVYTRAQAVLDAHGAVAAAVAVGYPTDRPLLLDVEFSAWQADPGTTEDAAAYWCRTVMASRGARAAWYGPCQSTAGWRACWTGQPPAALPARVVGIQYDHALAGDRYDISLFDAAFLPAPVQPNPPPTPGDEDMPILVVEASTPARYWVIAADLSHRVEVPQGAHDVLTHCAGYIADPGLGETALARIPDVTVGH